LRDQDVEGVPDDEGPDQEGDPGEAEKDLGEHAHAVTDGRRTLGCKLLASQGLGSGGQDGSDVGAQRRRGDPVISSHVDLIELADLTQQVLGGTRVEAGQRGPSEAVALPKAQDAHHLESLLASLEDDVDRVPDAVVGLLGGLRVQNDLVGCPRCATFAEGESAVELCIGFHIGTKGGGASRLDGGPVLVQDDREPGHSALGDSHARDCAHGADKALLERPPRLTRADVGEGALRAHCHIRTGSEAAVQLIECPVHRVGQDEGPRHEGNANSHRRNGQQQAQLVHQEVAHGQPEHLSRPAVPSSQAHRPESGRPSLRPQRRRRGR